MSAADDKPPSGIAPLVQVVLPDGDVAEFINSRGVETLIVPMPDGSMALGLRFLGSPGYEGRILVGIDGAKATVTGISHALEMISEFMKRKPS